MSEKIYGQFDLETIEKLADIVKKHSKPHLPLWSDVLNAQTNVTVNIKKMVGIVLPEIKAFPKLRYEHSMPLRHLIQSRS